MTSDLTRFYIVGLRPIRFVPTPEGGLSVLKMNWTTGAFEPGMEYMDQALTGKSEVTRVSEDEFIQRTEAWRARNLTGTGAVFALYSLMNAIEDEAKQQRRDLTAEERATVEQLRRETYELFERERPADSRR